ncbi:MAG: DUF6290 family protein [Clostridia bacterium]|nr:DUF6290 family protein [Clostridia bacterium]
MPHISLRVSENEKLWMESYARLHGLNISEAIKAAFIEKLEDEYDLKVIEEYEADPDKTMYSLEEVGKLLGIE